VKVSERSDTTKHTKKNTKKNTIIVASASRNQEPATQERALVVSMAECNALVSLVEREAPFLAFTADEKKIVCTLNNHELPARVDAVEAFVNGKKYQRLKARKVTEDWADKYKPFLVPSVNFPNMMFCALTNHVIQKKHAVVEGHLKGRKFKVAQGASLHS